MSDPDYAVLWTLSEALAWGQRHDPPDGFRDFLTTLHELSSSSRVQAFGFCQDADRRDALVPIAASDWRRLCFVSDGKGLLTADLFLALGSRCEPRFGSRKPIWSGSGPAAGAVAFATGLADRYWRGKFTR